MKPWEKYQQGPWENYAPPRGQRLAQAAAAGGSRGVLNLVDLLTRGPAGGYNMLANLTGLPALTSEDVPSLTRLGAAAPFGGIGAYQPQTPGEETAAFAGEMAGASMLPGLGAAALSTAPARVLGTEAAAAGGSILGGLLGQEIGGPEGRTLGAIAGGFAPMAAPYAARRFVSPYGQDTLQSRLAASQRQDVPITAGQAVGGSFLEKASATLPGGQRAAQTFAERQSARMGERVDELVRGQSAREPSSEAAGRAIQRGLNEWREGFRAQQRSLYNDVDELIPPDTLTPMTNTRNVLQEVSTPQQYEEWSKILDPAMLRQVQKALSESDQIPYQLLRTIRSRVGEKMESPVLLAGMSTGTIKRLYGALSRDLEDVAMAIGPEAERAATRANTFTRAGHQRVEDFLDPIQKKKLPEQAYKAAMAGTDEGASRLRAIKKSISPEQWNVVVATTLRRMGRARKSERTTGEIAEEAIDFSPETFLTNLEGLDPKARAALFTGNEYVGLERNLNDLMNISQGVRAQRQAAFNPSGTAGALANVSWLSALPFINPANTARLLAGVGGNVLTQRALQSPAMLNYLASPTAFSPTPLGQITRGAQAQ